jgi:hypothetical protein
MPLTTWDKLRDGISFRLIQLGYRLQKVHGVYAITKPIDPSHLEVLGDPVFQASVREVAHLTMLDTARLANLWNLCKLTDPRGHILEVGSYKGGGALHLSNCCRDRKVIVCDSFRGFETLDSILDKNFNGEMFKDSGKERVAALFSSRGRKHEVIAGFFPASCVGKTIGPVSFLHLDVDVYKATIESLNYLERENVLTDRALVVLDDYGRECAGVNEAVTEFTAACPRWKAFPLFPGQGLLVSAGWFPRGAT